MCWVLDGGFRCVSVRLRVHVRVQLARAFACVLMCLFVSICAREACVRVCVPLCGFVRFHRIALPRVCSERV